MKNKWFAYIKIFEDENCVQSSGITFNTFYNGICNKPHNILILKGYPDDAIMSKKLGLEFIPAEKVETFINDDVYNYGDFSWVDFENAEQLDELSDDKLAELLFFSHKAKPLKSNKIDGLGNKYAYYSHDDDWFVRVFVNDVKEYLSVIKYKILTELKGRKRYIAPIPDDISKQIYDLAREGVVVDFEDSYTTGVRLYKIGSVNNMDTIHALLDKNRRNLNGLCLDYSTASKKWRVY